MTMTTNALAQVFEGTATTVVSATADISDGTLAGGQGTWDNADGYPQAVAVLYLPSGFTGGAWRSGPSIDLYISADDVAGTADETPTPSSSDSVGAHYAGSFALDDHATIGTAQRRQIVIDVAGMRKVRGWIYNNSGRGGDYVAEAISVTLEGLTVRPQPAP